MAVETGHDGGSDETSSIAELSAFNRDTLLAVITLEWREQEVYGRSIQDQLERTYGELSSPRVYNCLNSLANQGLIEKRDGDGRRKNYASTTSARRTLADHASEIARPLGLALVETVDSDPST